MKAIVKLTLILALLTLTQAIGAKSNKFLSLQASSSEDSGNTALDQVSEVVAGGDSSSYTPEARLTEELHTTVSAPEAQYTDAPMVGGDSSSYTPETYTSVAAPDTEYDAPMHGSDPLTYGPDASGVEELHTTVAAPEMQYADAPMVGGDSSSYTPETYTSVAAPEMQYADAPMVGGDSSSYTPETYTSVAAPDTEYDAPMHGSDPLTYGPDASGVEELHTTVAAPEMQYADTPMVGGDPSSWGPGPITTEDAPSTAVEPEPPIDDFPMVGGDPSSWAPEVRPIEATYTTVAAPEMQYADTPMVGGDPRSWGPQPDSGDSTPPQDDSDDHDAGDFQHERPTYVGGDSSSIPPIKCQSVTTGKCHCDCPEYTIDDTPTEPIEVTPEDPRSTLIVDLDDCTGAQTVELDLSQLSPQSDVYELAKFGALYLVKTFNMPTVDLTSDDYSLVAIHQTTTANFIYYKFDALVRGSQYSYTVRVDPKTNVKIVVSYTDPVNIKIGKNRQQVLST